MNSTRGLFFYTLWAERDSARAFFLYGGMLLGSIVLSGTCCFREIYGPGFFCAFH